MSSNPLFPNSKSTGIEEAWEEAVWMDDTDKMERTETEKRQNAPSQQNPSSSRGMKRGESSGIGSVFLGALILFIILLAIVSL